MSGINMLVFMSYFAKLEIFIIDSDTIIIQQKRACIYDNVLNYDK